MPNINVRAGDEFHASWMDYCQENGIVSAEEIRAFIAQRLAERQEPTRPKVTRKNQKKYEVKLRLTEGELEDIRLRQRFNKSSRAGWIIKALRAVLYRQPYFDDVQTQAVIDATTALNAYGRNLNQVARSLNRNELPDKALKFSELVERVDKLAEALQALIDIGRSRWKISV